ncbi:hypothetical protein [Pedobacter deserti]|uniref:hypothetical protein n=1 Tax=Pedobacter deserti TaxID=2817382 RepID=UPI00210AEAF4|nr:hypothetical protein [Pedobacter sp. SYSU D00382]
MNLRQKLENISKTNTTSFVDTAKEKYNVRFAGNTVSHHQEKLNELLISVTNSSSDMHVGFDFNANDVKQWIDDLQSILEQYKLVNNLNHIPSYVKVRDIISSLVPTLNDSVKQLSQKVLKEVLTPSNTGKKLSKKEQRNLDIQAKIDRDNLDLIKKQAKNNKKGDF